MASQVISLSASLFLMQQWLEGFEYRMPSYADILIIGPVLLLLILLFAFGSQSLNAAMSNPVDGL
ncbi:MAG: hypothetical protein R8G66_08185 [Cytophagales bacterium]|nr:hypothetical protein [Cytophagales bacterium]